MGASPDPASAALVAAFERYASMLRRVALRYGLAGGEIDEVLQEVRIRLWSAREAEQIATVSASYLYRTAATAALTVIRRWRSNRTVTLADTFDGTALPAPASHDDAAARELADEVDRALRELQPAREAAVRMHLAGYPREEIEQLFGWSEGKTRNLLYRGLADLRARLTARGIGPEARR